LPNIRRMAADSCSKDSDAFETIYHGDHVPIAVVKLGDQTTIVVTKALGSPKGTPAFFRIGETYFPSMQVLEACAASDGGTEVRAHAVHSSSGSAQLFLSSEDDIFTVG